MTQFHYQTIADDLRGQIAANRWMGGERLPSVRDLRRHYQRSTATILHALHLLEAAGLIEARPKSGYFVLAPKPSTVGTRSISKHLPQPAPQQPPQPVTVPALFRDIMQRSAAFDILPGAPGANIPALPLLNRHIGRALRRQPQSRALYYNEPAGLKPLREEICHHYRQLGLPLEPRQLCITNGCQQSLFLALMACCQPGDTVAVESPAFYGVLQLLEHLQLQVVEIPASAADGMDIDALESALQRWPLRACVVTPAFATPSGACLPAASRRRLIALANHYELALVEDDIYGDLAFTHRPAPLKTLDSDDRVILCSSFSKSLSRDLRIGWISGGRWHDKITQLKLVTQLASNQTLQEGLASFMAEGHFRRHLRQYPLLLRQQRDQLISAIHRDWPTSTRFSVPDGGLALWLEMAAGTDTQAAYSQALAQGIVLTPGSLFTIANNFKRYLRLSFTHPLTPEREHALSCLAELLTNQTLR